MGEAGTGRDTAIARAISRAIQGVVSERVLPELLRHHPAQLLDPPTIGALADLAQDLAAGGTGPGNLAGDPAGRGAPGDAALPEGDAALLEAVRAVLPRTAGTTFPGGTDAGPLPVLCREVLKPVADELGERWVRDEISFAAVTIGSGRLHAVLRVLSEEAEQAAATWSAASWTASWAVPRILLLPAPGEDHRLGLAMAAALFRDAGWIVQTGAFGNEAALAALLDRLPPDLVGFSCACDRHLPALAEAVRAVRRSRPDLPVVAGGPLLARRPELKRRLRLDAAFTDGTTAPALAAELLRDRRLPGAARDPSFNLGRLPHREGQVLRSPGNARTGIRTGTRTESGTGTGDGNGAERRREARLAVAAPARGRIAGAGPARRGGGPRDRAGDD